MIWGSDWWGLRVWGRGFRLIVIWGSDWIGGFSGVLGFGVEGSG